MKKIRILCIAALLSGGAFAQQTERVENINDIINRRDLKIDEIDALAADYFARVGTGRGSGYKQYQRWKYESQFHLNEQGYVRNLAEEEMAYENFLTQSNQRIGYVPVGSWTQLGPTTWNRTSGWNPGNGRLTAMAIHPSNTNTIYVGSPGGGMWKSTNAGVSWVPVTDYNNLWMHIYSIAIDPANQNIVYAGTGNSANQVIKSTDGGVNWTVLGSGPTGEIRRILIHPTNSSIVFAAASNGIFRSTNGGTSWTQVHFSMKEDMEFKPGDPNTMYASGTGSIVRSTDNGVTWTVLGAGQGITNTGRSMIGVSAANPAVVYIVQASGSIFGRLYYSTNSGASFVTQISGSAGVNNFFGYNADGSDTGGQAWYDMAICVSPTNASLVHIAGIICFRSTNAGVSFTATTEWFAPNTTGYNHADIHGLEYVSTSLYSLSDGGIYRSTNNGDDWTDISNGLGIMQFYRIASSPTNTTVWTGGAQDNGSTASQSTGTLVSWLGADGMEGLVSPTNSLNIWGTSQFGQLYRSTNGGNSRANLAAVPGGDWVTPLAIHPTTESIIFAGGSGVYKSTNSGSTFSLISGAITATISDVAVAPSNANYIYACSGSNLYVTTNGGTSWTTYAITGAGSISDICVSPSTATKIWIATTGGKVRVSTNSGATFTDITGTLPAIAARTVVVDNTAAENLYVGMNIGVYTRNNTITTWSVITSNLPRVAINEIDIQNNGAGRVRVATYGRGVWIYNTPTACTETYEPNNSTSAAPIINMNSTIGSQISTTTDNDYYKFTLTAASTSVDFQLSNLPADYDLQLLDAAGVVLQSGTNGGTTNESFTRAAMTPGTYYLRVWGYNSAFSTTQCYNLDLWITGTPRLGMPSADQAPQQPVAKETTVRENPSLFPNPAGDRVTVDLSGVSNAASILILNSEGRVVARHDNVTSDNQVLLDISFLSQGIYFVQVVAVDGEMKTMKLLKQ
ncbi:MAG: T9SS type A sorting domain-containing protein [Bacteroidetes bacterium]|nr:T9SS type A sorting domain-containing protein [Bacteroidota bacterium]